MKKIKTQCPAKINLYLKVLDKRADGYHNIETSFQLIETFTERLSEKILSIFSMNALTLSVQKPSAIPNCKGPLLTIQRSK